MDREHARIIPPLRGARGVSLRMVGINTPLTPLKGGMVWVGQLEIITKQL